MTEPTEDAIARVLAARRRFDTAQQRAVERSAAVRVLSERIPVLSPERGELDLLRHKSSLAKQRELAEDFMEAAAALRQLSDLSEPIVDDLLVEARKIGRP